MLAMKLVLFVAPFAVFPDNVCGLAKFGQIHKFFGSSHLQRFTLSRDEQAVDTLPIESREPPGNRVFHGRTKLACLHI